MPSTGITAMRKEGWGSLLLLLTLMGAECAQLRRESNLRADAGDSVERGSGEFGRSKRDSKEAATSDWNKVYSRKILRLEN